MIASIDPKRPLSIAMIDIDDFKRYNDINGHVKGDQLLMEISTILKDEARRVDVMGRYGGEEFIMILPEMANDAAFSFVERIRKKVQEYGFFGKESQPKGFVSISAGLVTCMDKSIMYNKLIEIADQTLYKSKESGKNKVMSVIIIDKNIPEINVQEVENFNKQ
jgi:diguanylate cyclase (GGDEF)-like protein